MAPSLKNLLGNNDKNNRELTSEIRALLAEMQQERTRFESLLGNAAGATESLETLSEPLANATRETQSITAKLAELENRFAGMTQLSQRFLALDEQAEALARRQQQSEETIATALAQVNALREGFAEVGGKVDMASQLKGQLESFLDVEKPFQQMRHDADQLRSHVDGASEQVTRMREQHERLMDSHKLAMSKMEALDRRREELSRDLTDKERRVAGVEQGLRGIDGVQHTMAEVKREVSTVKALSELVTQKSTALESQRELVERTLARAEQLDQTVVQLDAAVRQAQDNEKSLQSLHENIGSLRGLHETVIERSHEITQLQHDADDLARATREELLLVRNEMKATVERFDFENRGLESVHQRVTDLRSSLSDFESRYTTLEASSQLAAQLNTQTANVATQLAHLKSEAASVDAEMSKLQAIRRDLDVAGEAARTIAAQVAQIEQAQPAVTTALRDVAQLTGAQASVSNALEQMRVAHDEIGRVRERQSETRGWLTQVEQSLVTMREQVTELEALSPSIAKVQREAEHVNSAAHAIESRGEFLENLHQKLAELGSLSARLDDRSQQLQSQIGRAHV